MSGGLSEGAPAGTADWPAGFGKQGRCAETNLGDSALLARGGRLRRRRPRLALVVVRGRPPAPVRVDGRPRRPATAALPAAELPAARAPPLRAGEGAARTPAVLHRAELRRPPLRPRHPQHRLRARQGHRRGGAVRHRTRPLPGRQRIPHPLHGPPAGAHHPAPGPDRRTRLHPALRHGSAERLGDELRLAVGPGHTRPQHGCAAGRLRPRHRGGRSVGVPPAPRRGPRVGDRAAGGTTAASTSGSSPRKRLTSRSSACR